MVSEVVMRPVSSFGPVLGGGTPKGDEKNWGGTIPFITPTELSKLDGKPVGSAARTITEEGARQSTTISAGVLVSCRAPIGSIGTTNEMVAYNQGCKGIPIGDERQARYLAYTLIAARDTLEMMGNGTTFAEISSTSLGQVRVPSPPLETQRAIADYLDRETAEIDAMSADLDEMEALLTERRGASVENHLLAGGAPDLSLLPDTWERTTLGTLFSLHNGDRGVNYPKPEEITDEGVPFINAGDLVEGEVALKTCKRVTLAKYEKMGGAKLKKGDLLFCLRGSLGKWGLMGEDGGSLASSLCALRLERPDLVDVRYVAHAMSTRVFSLQIWFNESGSAQPNLGAEQVARFRVPLPPLDEQRRIADEIDRETAEIDSMLADITELRDLLAERSAAVIAAAVTGQIAVPTSQENENA